MDNIIDLIATDASPAEVSDAIKNALFTKSAEKIDAARPIVAASMFGEQEYEVEDETETEIEQEPEEDQE
jgi:hypothetical protein